MIKRFFLALAFLAGMLSPAYPSGTISLSLTQQIGKDSKPLNGGKLYFYAAGTTTPQNAFQDSALTIPWPNPLTLDSSGRIPQLFFADGQIKIRLTDAAGIAFFAADNLLVVGPSGGGGGGGSVDATTVLATGDIKHRYGTGNLTGFVRANGRAIGSATSGATERANADAQALFEYLWTTDPYLDVSTGRGASANADWVANKTIALPDARNRAIAGLGDMGSTNANLFAGSAFQFGNGVILGTRLGIGTPRTIGVQNLPPYTPSGIASTSISHNALSSIGMAQSNPSTGGGGIVHSWVYNDNPGIAGASITASSTFTGFAQGGSSTAFDTVSPLLLMTIYLKL